METADLTDRLQAVFDLCDGDKLGYISVDHFVQLAAEHFGGSDWDTCGKSVMNEIIGILDPYGNGKIHFAEFCQGVQRILELQVNGSPGVPCSSQFDYSSLEDDNDEVTNDNGLSDQIESGGQMWSSEEDVDSGFSSRYADTCDVSHNSSRYKSHGPENIDESNAECLSEENSPDCSCSTPAAKPSSPPLHKHHITPSSVASHLFRNGGSLLMDTSRRSSMSEIMFDDIDGSFLGLTEKVKQMEEQITGLTESQQKSDEKQTKMKEENSQLIQRIHMLEEQLRDIEYKAKEDLEEEQRRHRELLSRTDRDKSTEIDILSQSLRHIEEEYESLKEEVPSLRAENEVLRKEHGHQQQEIEHLQQKLTELTEEHKSLQQHSQNEQLKMGKERSIQSQLLDEMMKELDELRGFKSEVLAKSPMNRQNELTRNHRKYYEDQIGELKKENACLREQVEDLHGQLLHKHVVEGRMLIENNNQSLAAEIENLSLDELKNLLTKEQESNAKLRDYIDRMTLRILEKNPSLLEIS